MNQIARQKITPAQWESLVSQRIFNLKTAWNAMAEEDRFWMVFNWHKEFKMVDPTKTGRQLVVCKPYWKTTRQ